MNVSFKLSLMKRMTRVCITTCCLVRESHIEVASDAPCCGWAFAGNHILGLREQLRINFRELHQNIVVSSLGNSIKTNCLKKKLRTNTTQGWPRHVQVWSLWKKKNVRANRYGPYLHGPWSQRKKKKKLQIVMSCEGKSPRE